jgi:hypothetical protein
VAIGITSGALLMVGAQLGRLFSAPSSPLRNLFAREPRLKCVDLDILLLLIATICLLPIVISHAGDIQAALDQAFLPAERRCSASPKAALATACCSLAAVMLLFIPIFLNGTRFYLAHMFFALIFDYLLRTERPPLLTFKIVFFGDTIVVAALLEAAIRSRGGIAGILESEAQGSVASTTLEKGLCRARTFQRADGRDQAARNQRPRVL